MNDVIKSYDGKRLILVCSSDSKEKYAEFLKHLITTGEDKKCKIEIWSDSNYRHNKSGISKESDRVLFIGRGDSSNKIRETTEHEFDRAGMRYGSHGIKGYAYIGRHTVRHDEYKEVLSLYSRYKTIFENKTSQSLDSLKYVRGNQKDVDILNIVGSFATKDLMGIGNEAKKTLDNILNDDKMRKLRRRQQQLCLMLIWYIDAYQKFMDTDYS